MKYKLGPELWKKIHKKAIKANRSTKRKKKFIKFINKVYKSIECDECKGHLRQFMDNEPIIHYLDIDHGVFTWTWRLHNAVNDRVGKEMIDHDDAFSMYA